MKLCNISIPEEIKSDMWKWSQDLFPINRSITGPGVRQTLNYLKAINPDLKIQSVKSGTKAFDWNVPDEWFIKDAFVADKSGRKIIDYKINNLHLVGYSEPIDKWVDHEELDKHLYSLPSQPNAIPYVTSYYSRNWGFCVSQNQRDAIPPGEYHVVIESILKPGFLNFGDIYIPSTNKSSKEILISTYICHPSMANNEISGPVVSIALANCIKKMSYRNYNYRFVFIPETIGSIVYISQNLDLLKKNTVAGFIVTCIGDERAYSYLPSRNGKTISDIIAKHILKHIDKNYKIYSWLDRGSDERQYCAPGIDLPIASIMRTKYPEYHTSLDDLGNVVTKEGLYGGLNALVKSLEAIENNIFPKVTTLCEPQLGKRDLYHNVSTKTFQDEFKLINDIIGCSDGKTSLIDMAEYFCCPIWKLYTVINLLSEKGVINLKRMYEN